ncbi:hypothetical protein [Mycobacteroides salmoniphilum]|uniref:hypothetical protein n=1 Tax=Mycobacteroides salmoniphilum TaxID=404941 RepID=UPI0009919914|nr:hypothetical protein [Mycobacteroides salmoniphilum]QCH21993.1 Pilin precursor [Mycobacteroides salmoniphilum]
MKILVGIAASAAIAASTLGLAATADAAPALPAPNYHWCPGEFWNPIWGFNWEFGECHDDWHRDRDGDWHDRDWHGDRDRGDWHDHDHDRGDWGRGHDRDWRP